jgi:hypothetical protein
MNRKGFLLLLVILTLLIAVQGCITMWGFSVFEQTHGRPPTEAEKIEMTM